MLVNSGARRDDSRRRAIHIGVAKPELFEHEETDGVRSHVLKPDRGLGPCHDNPVTPMTESS